MDPEPVPVVPSDPPARRRHRRHQGRWREQVLALPMGTSLGGSAPVDSMLPEEYGGVRAADAGWNLMSAAAVGYARARIPVVKSAGGVVQEQRLWRNLLSSQPLAFSIAGELRAHPAAAIAVLSELTGRSVTGFARLDADDDRWTLHGVQAEWAPRPDQHLGDRTAADLAAALRLDDGSILLITVEVKYTDHFSREALRPQHYEPHLGAVGLTTADADRLHRRGGTQFLRSVLLTDSVRRAGSCDEVLASVLGRADDEHARHVAAAVGAAVPAVPVAWWSIERFLDVASSRAELADWAAAMRRRYVLPEI